MHCRPARPNEEVLTIVNGEVVARTHQNEVCIIKSKHAKRLAQKRFTHFSFVRFPCPGGAMLLKVAAWLFVRRLCGVRLGQDGAAQLSDSQIGAFIYIKFCTPGTSKYEWQY